MTEQELIEQARQGDAAAVKELYDRHAPRVLAITRRFADDDAVAEDWAQDAWVQAIRSLPRFRGEARFSTWLYRIAVNRSLHGRRTGDRQARREAQVALSIPIAHTNGRALLRIRVEKALRQVPERMRQVLVLHDIEGYTHAEIAELLGITEGTSKSQLFKARARMRKLLRPLPELVEGEEVCHI
jgi:RNA polymerase sigma-70 factor, ECF subfamily